MSSSKALNLNNQNKTHKLDYKGASAEAIQHHYDKSNDFYRLWLDTDTSTYSAALWAEHDTLESAQLRKIDFHINQARASGAKKVLDIGCGWGGTLKHLVEKHNVEQAVGLTLSKAQVKWIESFNQPNVKVSLTNWFDYVAEEPFDAIISIGAFEHFAKLQLSQSEKIDCYRTFFQRCHQWLKPGGWMSLQTIVYENSRKEDFSKFVADEIFPESDLPRLADIAVTTERIFEIVAFQNDRKHYERTLKVWLRRLKSKRQKAIDLVGAEMVAKYEKYLSLSMIGFHTGAMNLSRITMHRID